MNIVEGESWLQTSDRRNAERLLAEWPNLEPGMFVQLQTWFGDIWTEITSVHISQDDPTRFSSVSFWYYEKYGVTRKEDHAYFGKIRKFATRDEINFAHCTVMTPTGKYDHGHKVEWPQGPHRRDQGNYEMHPTISKEQGRENRDAAIWGKRSRT